MGIPFAKLLFCSPRFYQACRRRAARQLQAKGGQTEHGRACRCLGQAGTDRPIRARPPRAERNCDLEASSPPAHHDPSTHPPVDPSTHPLPARTPSSLLPSLCLSLRPVVLLRLWPVRSLRSRQGHSHGHTKTPAPGLATRLSVRRDTSRTGLSLSSHSQI